MTQTVTLKDPGGNDRGQLPASADTEALLRAAWRLSDADALTIVADGDDSWLLCIYRAGQVPCLQPLDIRCGHVRGADIAANRSGMLETAWMALVDDGWTVVGD